jgi:hypothetical protein
MEIPALATSRSKRRKMNKFGRQEAFERLKSTKAVGGKNKWMEEKSSSVCEVVDEHEYSKIVQEQADDRIVDDGECFCV